MSAALESGAATTPGADVPVTTRPRAVVGGLVVLVAVALMVKVWAMRQWSWFQDDWAYVELAASMSFGDFVLMDYNGHFMPLQFALAWWVTVVAPLEYSVALIVLGILVCGSTITWAALFVRIFGWKPQILLPAAILLLTPLLLPSTLWWASGLQAYALQWGMALVLLGGHEYLRRGSPWILAGTCAAYLAALAMWQKSLLIAIVVAFLAVGLPGYPSGGVLRRRRGWLLGSVAAVSALWAAIFLVVPRGTGDAGVGLPGVEPFIGFALTAGLGLVLPGLAGGPWAPLDNLQSGYPPVATVVQWLLAVSALALAVFTVLYRRRGAWIIAMPLAYAAVEWGLVVGSQRFQTLGQYAAFDTRYSADLVPVMALALAYAITATRGESNGEAPPAWRSERVADATSPEGRRVPLLRALTVLVACAVSVSCLVSWSRGMDALSVRSPRPWVDQVLASAQAVAPANIFDSNAPDNVIMSAYFPERARLSAMLAPLGMNLTFDGMTSRLLVADAGGSLVPSELDLRAVAPPGPVPDCGYLVDRDVWTFVPLGTELYAWNWGVRVSYFGESGSTIEVAAPSDTTSAALAPGLETVTGVLVTAADTLALRQVDGDSPVCVTELAVGLVEPRSEPGP